MESPVNFIDKDTPWRPWDCTELGLPKKSIITRCEPFESASYTRATVEAEYPGFVRALENLFAIGCDKYLSTNVLKFCILQAKGLDVHAFLIESKTLSKVEAGLTIGLSKEELTALLSNGGSDAEVLPLPDDLGLP